MSVPHFKTKWKSPARMQIPFEVGIHSRESSSKSVETKRSAMLRLVLLLKYQTDGKYENGYIESNHVVCTVFHSPAVIGLCQIRPAVEPSVVAVSIKKKRSSFPASHKTMC